MIWIISLFSLFSLCGISAMKTAPTVYQAEENDSCTIRWDIQVQTTSLINMVCYFLSDPLKVLYEMVDGVEIQKSRDQQFVGRVRCDRDALREGRVRLHLSRLTADDSGSYWCKLVANYDEMLRRWELEASEDFVLNVTHTSQEEIWMSPITPKSGLEDEKQRQERKIAGVKWVMAAAALAVIAFVGRVAVTVFHSRKYKDQVEDKSTFINLLRKINLVKDFHQIDSSSGQKRN